MKRHKYVTAEQLREAAREAVDASDLTQAEIAELIGISQPVVSQAIGSGKRPASSYNGINSRLLSLLSGATVSGPYWRVENDHDG